MLDLSSIVGVYIFNDCLSWNVQGLSSKLNDADFLDFISNYDILIFTETWLAKSTNVNIDNYLCFSCPRPKYNKKAKRHSGGVILYYKKKYFGYIKLISENERGILWFKLSKTYFGTENDLLICSCYVPPEGSDVYKNRHSQLFEYDFFDQLSIDILNYSQLGDIMLTGDFNSRIGQKSDLVENINLDRYIDMPINDLPLDKIPKRLSMDSQSNGFGNKLLNICKENSIFIANGRLESGKFTCYNLIRNNTAASVVDYIIVNYNLYALIDSFKVSDLTEFSDHCPIEFTFNFCNMRCDNTHYTYDKITWNPANKDLLFNKLDENKAMFDNIVSNLLNGGINVNTCIEDFSKLVFDISYAVNGRTVSSTNSVKSSRKVKTSPWFDDECKSCKNDFYKRKRAYKETPDDNNKILFLDSRNKLCS